MLFYRTIQGYFIEVMFQTISYLQYISHSGLRYLLANSHGSYKIEYFFCVHIWGFCWKILALFNNESLFCEWRQHFQLWSVLKLRNNLVQVFFTLKKVGRRHSTTSKVASTTVAGGVSWLFRCNNDLAGPARGQGKLFSRYSLYIFLADEGLPMDSYLLFYWNILHGVCYHYSIIWAFF